MKKSSWKRQVRKIEAEHLGGKKQVQLEGDATFAYGR
jgi:hypothetical protein